ncbi:hypothetical protein [Lewinella sp. W8]|uniref:hypothetical protein n=1 Tax=Lewinella sp. W8 TaxID=2528208 RepID=UPI0010675989|nr:hypothetical protein [Lewinella sp. W8]MTB51147.1 hypothetical protein [Lewinella sp. W8]
MQVFRSILPVLFLLCGGALGAQVLPDSWHGQWRGTVDIWSYGVKVDSFPMALTIRPEGDRWQFVINYRRNPDQPDVRRYQLVALDGEKGHFAIDEQNSILLDTYLVDDCLLNVFAGMGSSLQTRICHEGDFLSYEITSNFDAPERVSGGEVMGQDTVPEIRSYTVYNQMKARLRKDNEE